MVNITELFYAVSNSDRWGDSGDWTKKAQLLLILV